MSEAMAIESIVQEYAKFKGYLTETRVPFKLKRGHSDLDVLGFNPKTKNSLVAECKAWGSPNQYPSYNNSKKWFKEKFEEIIAKWEHFKNSPTNKWRFSKLDEIWYVIPGYCDDKEQVEADLSTELDHNVRIIPIHELILDVMFEVKKDKDIRRKRYSNPALEFCRWLLRGYDAGKLNLIDLDLKLKKERQTYETLKRKYFKDCLRVIEKNVKGRGKFVDTRKKSLELLCKVRKEATVPELEKEAYKRKYDMNYNRISVGLGTWIELGIVTGNNEQGYSINESFKTIVRKELKS